MRHGLRVGGANAGGPARAAGIGPKGTNATDAKAINRPRELVGLKVDGRNRGACGEGMVVRVESTWLL